MSPPSGMGLQGRMGFKAAARYDKLFLHLSPPGDMGLKGGYIGILGEYSFLGLGFPKIRGTFVGVPIIRIRVFGGCILGSPVFGKIPNTISGFGMSVSGHVLLSVSISLFLSLSRSLSLSVSVCPSGKPEGANSETRKAIEVSQAETKLTSATQPPKTCHSHSGAQDLTLPLEWLND